MNWITIAVAAYFLGALSFVGDKFILSRVIASPVAYAFYVGMLSVFAAVLFPFDMVWSGWLQLVASLLVGAVFLFALLALFAALKYGETSVVLPVVGGLTPIFIGLGSYVFLDEHLAWSAWYAFMLLVAGGILMSSGKFSYGTTGRRHILLPVAAAFLFGLFYVTVKYIFMHQPFVSGFIWTRLGSFAGAWFLLLTADNRKIIFDSLQQLTWRSGGWFVGNKLLAGLSFLLLNYAVFLGSATLVNAMQGIQYFFVLAIALIVSPVFPDVFKEKISFWEMARKLIAIIMIGAGLALLAL